mgnify:CR=1 FL=1
MTDKSTYYLRFIFLMAFIVVFSINANAQEDLIDILEEESQVSPSWTTATFKGTRMINGHSIETRNQYALDFIISHRFGRVNSGIDEFFGLDNANIRLGLDYAITDLLTIGVGRSSFQKVYDGYLKYKIIRQGSGQGQLPLTVTGLVGMAINTLDWANPERAYRSSDRYSYTYQLLIARKFSDATSVQLMPTLIHRNLVPENRENNNLYALGIGGRQKLTQRVALTFEYYYQFNNHSSRDYYNPVAIGFDIETGGHVFQLHFTNAQATYEPGFIPQTTGNFFDGDIHFGFNITRTFQLK